MLRNLTYCLVFLFLAISCKKAEKKEDAIVRVFDTYLFRSDLAKILPENLSEQDSVLRATDYVNNWVKEQLLLKKAEINLEEDASITELVNKYRKDLLINKYKNAAVEEYLDTVITNENISSFYNKNRDIFKLNEELIQFKYINFGKDVINPGHFEELFKSRKKADKDSLKAKEFEFKSFNLNDTIWIRFSDVRKKIPTLTKQERDLMLGQVRFLKKKDSTQVYLIAVRNALKRNQIAPQSYVLPTIKQMILHKRKIDLLKKIEETLVDDAIKNKEYEIYKPE